MSLCYICLQRKTNLFASFVYKGKSICLHHVFYSSFIFSKINNTRNNKRGRQRKEDCGNIKKSVKRRTLFSTKRAENVHEPIEESYKNISGRDRDQYNGMIEDNYRAEKRKSISSREDESRIEKQKIEANINDDRIDCRNSDMIESRNIDNDNDKTSGKESVECNMSSTVTREMES